MQWGRLAHSMFRELKFEQIITIKAGGCSSLAALHTRPNQYTKNILKLRMLFVCCAQKECLKQMQASSREELMQAWLHVQK